MENEKDGGEGEGEDNNGQKGGGEGTDDQVGGGGACIDVSYVIHTHVSITGI